MIFFMVRNLGTERKESTHLDKYADGDDEQVEQEDVGDVLYGAVLGEMRDRRVPTLTGMQMGRGARQRWRRWAVRCW